MFRAYLLGASALAASVCLAPHASAQESTTSITGGGSTSAEFDYFNELSTFNQGQPAGAATFNNPSPATGQQVLYWASGGAGQTAFLNDDLSCDANKVLKINGGNCSGTVGGSASVDYAASDSTLVSSQVAQWASSSVGQSAAGNLIQLPSMGTGEAIPVVNASVTANGRVTLKDSDLCGIFSGKITDWSQTSAAASVAPGTISVVYRSDTAGATFIFLNHLSAVCTSANSNFVQPIVPSTTFLSTLPGGVAPSNFVGESGSSGVANYLAGQAGVTVTSAIGYITPDWTSVDPNSNAVLANGSHSPLVVASLLNGKTAYQPTVANLTLGLNHAKLGTHLKPPTTAAEAADPTNFVPVIETTSSGYPIVGYTTFDLAQCYASPAIASGILGFLTAHYANKGAYATSISNNGLVAIAKSGATKFAAVITKDILTNKSKFNLNIQNATACNGLVGR